MVYVIFENPSGPHRQLCLGPYESVQVLHGKLFVQELRGGKPQRVCLAVEGVGGWHVHAGEAGPGSVWESARFAGEAEQGE